MLNVRVGTFVAVGAEVKVLVLGIVIEAEGPTLCVVEEVSSGVTVGGSVSVGSGETVTVGGGDEVAVYGRDEVVEYVSVGVCGTDTVFEITVVKDNVVVILSVLETSVV